MKLSLGFSPCPNDTFIFDALIHGKIDTEGLTFDVSYLDVETLNQKAFQNELHITKLSFNAFAHVAEQYALLQAGSALGFGVGPLLICKQGRRETIGAALQSSDCKLKVGIPGKYTTANFLLSIAYPQIQHKEEMVFSDIEQALLDGHIDAGLIIHENRFTYQNKGLEKIIDLGEYWEKQTGCAIPLGGIVIQRSLPIALQQQVERLIRQSVEFAFAHPQSGIDFIRSHAQAMDEAVMYKHIELYVNEFSVHLGEKGREAIQQLFKLAHEKGIIPASSERLFID